MTATTTTNGKPANGTLSPGWRVIRFGEMADSIGDRVDHPAEAGVEYYVGLEHLDPESLKIRRWGQPTDVEATKLRFKPGDIIFGRRRAYQRKLAVAKFEGICSAHALVLRAREEVVLPEFLPFFMQSDIFFERAISISVGSLSPTINWKTLAQQEFALPPRDEQRRIAEILWAADEAVESQIGVLTQATVVRRTFLNEVFDDSRNDGVWTQGRLVDYAVIQTGVAKGKKYDGQETIELPYLSVANVQDGYLDLNEVKKIRLSRSEAERYKLRHGDVLLTEGGDPDKLGRGAIWREEVSGCLHQNHVFCVRPHLNLLLPEFLSYQTGSPYGKRYFLRCAKQTTNLATINTSQVKNFPLLVPSLSIQQKMVDDVQSIEAAMQSARRQLDGLAYLKAELISQVLTPFSER